MSKVDDLLRINLRRKLEERAKVNGFSTIEISGLSDSELDDLNNRWSNWQQADLMRSSFHCSMGEE